MKIRLLETENWMGLYIDDKVVMEDHDLDIRDVIEEIAGRTDLISSFKCVWVDNLGSDGYCPDKWTKKLEEKAK